QSEGLAVIRLRLRRALSASTALAKPAVRARPLGSRRLGRRLADPARLAALVRLADLARLPPLGSPAPAPGEARPLRRGGRRGLRGHWRRLRAPGRLRRGPPPRLRAPGRARPPAPSVAGTRATGSPRA